MAHLSNKVGGDNGGSPDDEGDITGTVEPRKSIGDIKLDETKNALLTSSREEMYTALSLFYSHVKHSMSLMFAVITAVFAVLGVMGSGEANIIASTLPITTLAGAVLLVLFPVSIITSIIISRYYRLYVSALIFSAELHEEAGLGFHGWFEQINDYRNKEGSEPRKSLIDRRTYGWRHSWFLYSVLLWITGIVGLTVGISLLF